MDLEALDSSAAYFAALRANSSLAGLNATRSKKRLTEVMRPPSTRSHSTMGTLPAGVSVTKS